MTHIEQRLQERGIQVSPAVIAGLCYEYDNDTAVIMERGNSKGGECGTWQSNGDVVILIIRNHQPKTIMFRRSNQPMTAKALDVAQVVTL